MIGTRITRSDGIITLFVDEDRKVITELGADLIANTAVDTGELRNAWQIDPEGGTIKNPKPYAHRIMEGGHSKQTPAGTLTNLIDKYTR